MAGFGRGYRKGTAGEKFTELSQKPIGFSMFKGAIKKNPFEMLEISAGDSSRGFSDEGDFEKRASEAHVRDAETDSFDSTSGKATAGSFSSGNGSGADAFRTTAGYCMGFGRGQSPVGFSVFKNVEAAAGSFNFGSDSEDSGFHASEGIELGRMNRGQFGDDCKTEFAIRDTEEPKEADDCAEQKTKRALKCFNCQEVGHSSPYCKRTCGKCDVFGHISKDCNESKKPSSAEAQCRSFGECGRYSQNCALPIKYKQKAPVLYEPPVANLETLFIDNTIEAGTLFNHFFDADVVVTRGGREIKVKIADSFENSKISPEVVKNVRKAGHKQMMPVQGAVIPLVLDGLDLIACAHTGSGKTSAYLLPLITILSSDPEIKSSEEGEARCCPRCIVILPTRELADQIFCEARKFTDGTNVVPGILYGGTSVACQKTRLSSDCSLLVVTPGRFMGFVEKGVVSLKRVKYLVLDEADRLLEKRLVPEIKLLCKDETMARKENLQTLMFSATFGDEVQEMATHFLRSDYAMVTVDVIGSANRCIKQEFVIVNQQNRKDQLLRLLGIDVEKYKAEGDEIFKLKTLVFVGTKQCADFIGTIICRTGIPSTTIHGDRYQNQREEALRDFRRGTCPVLIATAVAERGLDIRGVDHVINYDVPKSRVEYVHRIGRTGRVGNIGRATTLFDPERDREQAGWLIDVLTEVQQEPPNFLLEAAGFVARGNADFERSAKIETTKVDTNKK